MHLRSITLKYSQVLYLTLTKEEWCIECWGRRTWLFPTWAYWFIKFQPGGKGMGVSSRPYPLNLSFGWWKINTDWRRWANGPTSISKVMAWSYNIRTWTCRHQIFSEKSLMFSTHREGNCGLHHEYCILRTRQKETNRPCTLFSARSTTRAW